MSKDSKNYMCFITPWGLLRFKRIVMGLISAGNEHNLRGDLALEGMENAKKIIEDIVIYDKDLERHLERVTNVLEWFKAAGISLHMKKAQFGQPSVEWCWYTLSEAGYFPREGLVDTLTHFPRPVSRMDTRSFYGLVQQVEAFSPRHHCNDETDHNDNVGTEYQGGRTAGNQAMGEGQGAARLQGA